MIRPLARVSGKRKPNLLRLGRLQKRGGKGLFQEEYKFGHVELSIGHTNEEFELATIYKILELKGKVQDGDINRGVINI